MALIGFGHVPGGEVWPRVALEFPPRAGSRSLPVLAVSACHYACSVAQSPPLAKKVICVGDH